MRGILVLTLLLGPLLSGCIAPGDEAPEPEDLGVPSAQAAVDDAQVALTMNGTGHLFYGILGVETMAAGAYFKDRVPAALHGPLSSDDTVIGDGRVPAWLGFWKDAEGAPLYTVSTTGSASAMYTQGSESYPFGRGFLNDMASRVPIGKGWIDSTRALDIALDDDDELRSLMERFDVEILMVLQRQQDAPFPVWVLIASPLGQPELRRIHVVDASGGYSITATDYYRDIVFADNHHDQTATPLEPATTVFDLERGVGIVFLEFEPGPAGTYQSLYGLVVEVEHPDGIVETIDTSRWPREVAYPVYSPPAGRYTVRAWPVVAAVGLEIPTVEQVHTHWCIAGVMPDPTGLSRAGPCDRYYEFM